MTDYDPPATDTTGGDGRTDLTRRGFVWTAAAGGAAAWLGCRPAADDPTPGDRALPWVKDPSPFIQHPTNLETRLELLAGHVTPNDLFFVRNHAPTPRLDAQTWRLRVEGDGITNPIDLTYDDLLRLPTRSTLAYLECAGNWRGFYQEVMGQVASGGQWKTGAVGCAWWSGAALADVLELAGIERDAVDVNLVGLDDGGFSRPMPVATALAGETILAYSMNGADLPADHGYPVRGIVPGWVGSNSIKWLGRIEVSGAKIWGKNNTTSYVLIGPEWPPDRHAPAAGGPITTLVVKAALALPWPAALRPGQQRIRGFAHSPHGPIRRVEWRVDAGPWRDARLVPPILEHAWARFELTWDASPGPHTVRVRATDAAGNVQPDQATPNDKGYLLNVPLPHPVEVA